KIILGARSSVFLPFGNLGLVIIDEEHENSFKQSDPSPRYHARDTALQLARIHNAKSILGSATPSLESFYNTEIKKYGFAEILHRHGGIEMPEILLVDVKEEQHKKLMHSHFSKELIERITV